MSSPTTVRHPKGPPETNPSIGAVPFLWAFFDSSVGAKITVALTGLGLVTFTVFHMIGNLKVFSGPAAINNYAHFLKHDLGLLIWIARAGLLGIFVLHLTLTLRLSLRSKAARPVPYAHPGSVQATVSSRTMIWSGIAVGLFVLFHLAHFTFAWVHGVEVAPGQVVSYLDLKVPNDPLKHDVYSMVVAGFTTPWLAVLYIVAQVVLFVHLLHGIQSSFQTLGLKNGRFAPALRLLGFAVAATILAGNLIIVIGVWAGYAPHTDGLQNCLMDRGREKQPQINTDRKREENVEWRCAAGRESRGMRALVSRNLGLHKSVIFRSVFIYVYLWLILVFFEYE